MGIIKKPFGNTQSKQHADTGGLAYISERHVACVFLLDTSGSMSTNDAIGKLNEGLRIFKSQTVNDVAFDEHTKSCIDVAMISFGPDVAIHGIDGRIFKGNEPFDMANVFVPVSVMNPPVLTAEGGTPMGGAIDRALDLIAQQKARYNDFGTPYFRPWIFCITDGEPNDDYQAAAQRLKRMENDTKVLGYCIGVEGFNKSAMATIFNSERIFELDNLDFPGLFKFVSSSLTVIRNSDPNGGNQIDVPAPKTLRMTF
jgi:uncharacterized protein YegL